MSSRTKRTARTTHLSVEALEERSLPAAGLTAQLLGGAPHQIEYASEIGLEHHLGLTCDPILGLVQISCIEQNVFAAIKALASAEYALLSNGRHLVSFDQAVEVIKQTGHDLPSLYRETSLGGLAKVFNQSQLGLDRLADGQLDSRRHH